MSRNKVDLAHVLANNWSAPAALPIGVAGRPVICIASTYTFHAPFFESELLPRFLGLKFDETEGVRPFVVEREQALALAQVCVLVDADHFDPSQTTLRWDQLPVRVRGGAQHSKVVVLIWENCARLIVSSANLTRSGYRKNREIVGVIDFHDDDNSAPRKLFLDALAFLQDVSMSPWVRASEAPRNRLLRALEDARARSRSWRQMPIDFKPRERPRVAFVAGMPGARRGVARSPLQQMLDLWGARRTTEVTVMTPFVGDLAEGADPVVEKLLEIPRTRDAMGYLVVPGTSSDLQTRSTVVGLPRRFRDAWSSAWRIDPSEVPTFVVPLCRKGEPKATRDLHAKGILLGGDGAEMLLCGSSNFSPRGMGVGVANVEANLCYLDDFDVKRAGLRLMDRLPVDWDEDFCNSPKWPEEVEPTEDERPTTDQPLPAAFLWAVYNQRTAVLTLELDPAAAFPSEWSLRWPGEALKDAAPLADQRQWPQSPPEGRIVLQLPAALVGANIAGLRLVWLDEKGLTQSATLPVHVEKLESLLPPEEFRTLTAIGIVDCLISGREPAEWVEALERGRVGGKHDGVPKELDPLRRIDTSGYLLYRTRRFGAALAALGERLQRTIPTHDAMGYRLRHDPLGPCLLAEALIREWRDAGQQNDKSAHLVVLLFSLAEIKLVLAHLARRTSDARLRPLFREAIDDIDRHYLEVISSRDQLPANILDYLKAVDAKTEQLLGGAALKSDEVRHAG